MLVSKHNTISTNYTFRAVNDLLRKKAFSIFFINALLKKNIRFINGFGCIYFYTVRLVRICTMR